MESTYIKETLGPVLTQALADIVQHVPHSQHTSSYSSMSDPITVLGKYLLEYDALTKQEVSMAEKKQRMTELLQNHSAKEQKSRESRVRMRAELETQMSGRRSILDGAVPATIPEAEATQ